MNALAFNQAQHIAMLDELACTAGRVAELARMVQSKVCDDVDADVLAVAIETMAQRMGWLSVIARQAHQGEPPGGARADAWLMPPIVAASA